MNGIYDILNIDFNSLCDYPKLANLSVNYQLEKKIEANIRKLGEIENSIQIADNVPSPLDIDKILNKVRWYARQEEKVGFSMRELRIVSFYMVKLQGDTISYDYAIDLLRNNWKSLYFRGLVYYVLNSWNTLYKEYRIKVCELIRKKLSEYQDHNKRYLLLKDHANYFEEEGPLRMSKLVTIKEMNLFDAPQIIGYKSSSFTLSFYSDVILYYLKEKEYDLTLIEKILEKHELDRTKKLIFSNLVRIADELGDEFYQTRICKLANRFLGDITVSQTWMPFIGATEKEVEELREAKELVNLWFTKKIIETFFEVCVQDKTRKNFWLKYVNWVNDFKVFGSALIESKLKADNRIENMLGRFFMKTKSRNSQNAALALCIRGKVLIEFSDVGRLYVYDAHHPIVRKIKSSRSIDSLEDLKRPEMNKLINLINFQRNNWGQFNNYEFEDEGHLNHRGEWDIRLEGWMNDKLRNDNFAFVEFTSQKDNEVFVEKPIPIEEVEIRNPEEETTDLIIEKSIKIRFQSQWLFGEEKCRVVTSKKGFYIFVKERDEYIFIKLFESSEHPIGYITLTKSSSADFQGIIHIDSKKTYKVGYIKKDDNQLIFKEEIEDKKEIKIKID